MTLTGHRAEILTIPDDTRVGGVPLHHPDGLLVVEDGLVIARGAHADLAPRFPGLAITEHAGKLLIPGFVDAHVHYPQTDRIASFGLQLLDWLDRYIFPAERAFADPVHARAVADFFLDELLRNGTTSALVYATVHSASVDALFEAALARNMRIISGKVLMDLGPEGLRDTVESGRAESEALIARWCGPGGRGRLGYAVTPRYALACSEAQLAMAGELVAAHPEVLLHTHLSENVDEIAAVNQRFAGDDDYVGVYDRFGLVTSRSVFAHGVHLSDRECARLTEAGSGIALCPTSNLFLGSGLFNAIELDVHMKLGFGTDIGAGTSFSQLATMAEAYKVCQLGHYSLAPFCALYLATAGGAALLGIGDRVGALEVGQEADFVILNPYATPLTARRCTSGTLSERLFAMQMLGDDRMVEQVWLMGKKVKG